MTEGHVDEVVYLLGAGASQGCAQHLGSAINLLMAGLTPELNVKMQDLYDRQFAHHAGIMHLVNEVVDDDTDLEQFITFLEDAVSDPYRRFGSGLKEIFATVLSARLDKFRSDHGDSHADLLAILLDMHEVSGGTESLRGFLTLNYDDFLEHAIRERLQHDIDYGIAIERPVVDGWSGRRIPVLKLHGSLGWSPRWPVTFADDDPALWIPPGIKKAKTEYPFNIIWGRARELLDCDVLRIVGVNLGPNDWDLLSLLFATIHTHDESPRYRVEVISRPATAQRIRTQFPYLNVVSLLEIPDVGAQMVSELLGGAPRPLGNLTEAEQSAVFENAQATITNALEYWLRVKGELLYQGVGTDTPYGMLTEFVGS